MFPVPPKGIAVKSSRVLPNQESSEETDAQASWSHWKITDFSTEVLVNLFGWLGFDDIVQVQNTCRTFRSVVQSNHLEGYCYFFKQFSTLFRKQYRQALSWHKSLIQSGNHPFITSMPIKVAESFFNVEQYTGILCYSTLGAMMSTPKYKAVKVFDEFCPVFDLRSRFCTANPSLLLCEGGDLLMRLINRDSAGSWSAQAIDGYPYEDRGNRRVISFSADGGYLFSVIDRRTLEVRKYDHDRWQLTNTLRIEGANSLEVSPSGKYLVVCTTDGIESIRFFDDDGDWKSMGMAKDTLIDRDFEWHGFSPSEQHLVFRYKQKLVILSQERHGCWHISWQTDSNTGIDYVQFCPSGSWLLFACEANGFDDPGSVEMLRFDLGGNCVPWQTISPRHHKLTFSPAGNYLISQDGVETFLLWQLVESGQWQFNGELTGYAAPPERSVFGQTDSERDTVTLSSCDRYLLISSQNGLVKILGQDDGQDGQGGWTVRGSEQHENAVSLIKFSGSGVHAITVDRWAVHIWGRGKGGLWSVKGKISIDRVERAYFHPVADHLLVIHSQGHCQVWEIQRDDSTGESDWEAWPTSGS